VAGVSGHPDLATLERLDEAFERVGLEKVRALLAGKAPAEAAPIVDVSTAALDPSIEVDLSRWGANWPGALRYSGITGWLDFWRDWLEPWQEFHYRRLRSESIGGWIVSEVDLEVRGRGSGVPVEIRFCQIWGFREGRIVRLITCQTWDEGKEIAAAEPVP
jgi:hypothetical protein